jgi:hypothetical protein
VDNLHAFAIEKRVQRKRMFNLKYNNKSYFLRKLSLILALPQPHCPPNALLGGTHSMPIPDTSI